MLQTKWPELSSKIFAVSIFPAVCLDSGSATRTQRLTKSRPEPRKDNRAVPFSVLKKLLPDTTWQLENDKKTGSAMPCHTTRPLVQPTSLAAIPTNISSISTQPHWAQIDLHSFSTLQGCYFHPYLRNHALHHSSSGADAARLFIHRDQPLKSGLKLAGLLQPVASCHRYYLSTASGRAIT
jgi:hypothetical protein